MAGQDGGGKKKNRQRPHGRGAARGRRTAKIQFFRESRGKAARLLGTTARQAQNVNKTGKRAAHPVTESAALARTRFRRFSIFPFTASPSCRNGLCTTALGVKTLGCAPSPFLHPRLHRRISGIYPISRLARCACRSQRRPSCGSADRGEGENAKPSPAMGRQSAGCAGWVKR